MSELTIGAPAPGFRLPNQHGGETSLAEFAGRRVLLWFYPRAFGNN